MLFAIDDKIIEQYVETHTGYINGDEYLDEIERFTFWHTVNPRMISGKIQARLLQFMVMALNPSRVLEVGTFTGYSAVAMANVLKKGGKIFSFEVNPQYTEIAKSFFAKFGMSKRIILIEGDVRRMIDVFDIQEFDLIFIDGEKDEYVEYYETLLPYLSAGGLMVADNVLWSKKIFDTKANDKKTRHLRDFNEYVSKDDRVHNFILPVRDGLMLIKKKPVL